MHFPASLLAHTCAERGAADTMLYTLRVHISSALHVPGGQVLSVWPASQCHGSDRGDSQYMCLDQADR